VQKIQVFLRDDQKLARQSGRNQSEFIRGGVDLILAKADEETADWRAVTREVAGIWADRTDLDTVTSDLRERSKQRFKSTYLPE
jgi:Arc/MetJ-type ribon-helix-helix transcriptional regulator